MVNIEVGGQPYSPRPSDPQACAYLVQPGPDPLPGGPACLLILEDGEVSFRSAGSPVDSDPITATFTAGFYLLVYVSHVTAADGAVLAIGDTYGTYD